MQLLSVLITTRGGTAAAMSLDWFKPIESQIPTLLHTNFETSHFFECEVILASDTVWLRELLIPFVETVSALLQLSHNAVCYLAYKDRSKATESSVFVNHGMLVTAFAENGCNIQQVVSVPDLYEQRKEEILIFKISKNC